MSALVFNMIIASLDARFPFSNNRESRIKKPVHCVYCTLFIHRKVQTVAHTSAVQQNDLLARREDNNS